MKRFADLIRLALVSPETLVALLPFACYLYSPEWTSVLVKPMRDGLTFGLSGAGIALAAAAFCYKEGGVILEPSGSKSVLLEWPGYFMLKARVLVAIAWCLLGVAAALLGTWLAARSVAVELGATVLVAGLLAAAAATASVALARYRIREILPSK